MSFHMLNSYIRGFGKSILKYVFSIMFNYFDQIFIFLNFCPFLSALSLSFSLSCLVLSLDWIGIRRRQSDFCHAFCSVPVYDELGKNVKFS